jgi:hypothetical protein
MIDPRAAPPDDADPGDSRSAVTGPESAATGDALVGRAWGDLLVLNELGKGGFGQVYRAWDETLQREVALKIIKPRDGAHRADVLREGQMLARVKHPHVVTVFRAQQVGDEVGITMELIKGHHLSEVVAHTGPMSAEEASMIGVSLCQAIAAVHGAGLLHRDIKTRNVMREAGGRIVLMDFGAGREAAPSRKLSDVTGTPLYLAPELFSGGTASAASDLYSLGVLLFFLVTREYPVNGRTIVDLALKHGAGERRLLSDLRPDLPIAFVQVVDRALAPKPEQRYQTAGALMRGLAEVVREHPAPPDPEPAPHPAPRDSVLLKWAVTLVGAGLAIWIMGFLTTQHYDRALSRPADMTGEGVGTWFYYGAGSLVLPAAATWGTHLSARLLLAIWYFVRRAIPSLGKVTDLARSSISGRLAPDGSSIAQGLLLLEVAVIGLWAWGFWPTLENLPIDVNTASAESLALLNPDQSNGLLYLYRFLVIPVLAVGAVAWRWLLTKSAARATVPRGTAAAGIALLAVVLLLLATPYRLFYRSFAPAGTYNEQRCFEIGRNSDKSLLYCPDSVEKDRIKSVKSSEFATKGGVEPIFLLAH